MPQNAVETNQKNAMIRLNSFPDYLSGVDDSIRDVLQRINAGPHLFQLIASKDGKLLGTVTDGDLRRAILKDVSLDEPASLCMNRTPVAGNVNEPDGNLRKLAKLYGHAAFLPVLNDDGFITEVLIGNYSKSTLTTALVMAGGAGKRLGERTRHTPKPLLSVGGKPILEHVLLQLEQNGIDRIFISVHHFADQIRAFVEARENTAVIELLEELKPLGTAGALSNLPSNQHSPTLIINGDVLTKTDLSAMVQFHDRHTHDATVAIANYDVEVPFGVIRQTEDGLFSAIDEKPRISHFIAAGIYILSSEILNLVPKNQNMDMPHLLNLGREIGLRIGLFPIHEYWIDVGRPDDLNTADTDYTKSAVDEQ